MLKVLVYKQFPSGAQLTKLEYAKEGDRFVFYVRENVRKLFWNTPPEQILEVSAPVDRQAFAKLMVEAEDDKKRKVELVDFMEWAEGELAP